MTAAEFRTLAGVTFPLSLSDLPAALDRLARAGYIARVVNRPRIDRPINLELAVEKSGGEHGQH